MIDVTKKFFPTSFEPFRLLITLTPPLWRRCLAASRLWEIRCLYRRFRSVASSLNVYAFAVSLREQVFSERIMRRSLPINFVKSSAMGLFPGTYLTRRFLPSSKSVCFMAAMSIAKRRSSPCLDPFRRSYPVGLPSTVIKRQCATCKSYWSMSKPI